MKRTRLPHPADAANDALVASATSFKVSLFLGVGRYASETAATLDEALIIAERLTEQHQNGRKPLIYGIHTNGQQGLVTEPKGTSTVTKKKTVPTPPKAATKAKPKLVVAPPPQAAPKPAPSGKRAAILAAAEAGTMPAPPDFSAETHARFRTKLHALVALAEARDIAGLRKFEINPVSSSPKALQRYRDLCVTAIEATGR